MQKLFCYVDESGQNTLGKLFVVAVVIAKSNRAEMYEFLEGVEQETGKKKTKWVRTQQKYKVAYLDRIFRQRTLRGCIFFTAVEHTKAYKETTLITIAAAITAAKDDPAYKASVFIDGLSAPEVLRIGTALRKIGVRTEKIRGLADQHDALIRLADAIAGLVREYCEGVTYAQPVYKLGIANQMLKAV